MGRLAAPQRLPSELLCGMSYYAKKEESGFSVTLYPLSSGNFLVLKEFRFLYEGFPTSSVPTNILSRLLNF